MCHRERERHTEARSAPSRLLSAQVLSIFGLFMHFFFQSYASKPKKDKKAVTKTESELREEQEKLRDDMLHILSTGF